MITILLAFFGCVLIGLSIFVLYRGSFNANTNESDAKKLFDRFWRADPSRARVRGGTGLGLSIVKHVASKHGGEVTVWSVPGVGSTFSLRLPVYTPTQESVQ